MVVKVIPLAEHDEVYSAEDIELWEVRRNSNNSNQLDIVSKQSSPPTLLVKNWGNVPLVRCTIDNIDVEITQEMEHRGIIGGVLWPCSVIVSR